MFLDGTRLRALFNIVGSQREFSASGNGMHTKLQFSCLQFAADAGDAAEGLADASRCSFRLEWGILGHGEKFEWSRQKLAASWTQLQGLTGFTLGCQRGEHKEAF